MSALRVLLVADRYAALINTNNNQTNNDNNDNKKWIIQISVPFPRWLVDDLFMNRKDWVIL